MRPGHPTANPNAQRLRAGRGEARMAPPPCRGPQPARPIGQRREGGVPGGVAAGPGYIRRDPGAPPHTRALGGWGVCGALSSRPRQGPADSAVRALAAPALRGPGRRAAGDSPGRGGAAAARPWDVGAGPGWSPPRRRRGGRRGTGASRSPQGAPHRASPPEPGPMPSPRWARL